jgi:hypothetical protein
MQVDGPVRIRGNGGENRGRASILRRLALIEQSIKRQLPLSISHRFRTKTPYTERHPRYTKHQSPSLNSLTSQTAFKLLTNSDRKFPQMQSFDFNRLDPIALEATLAYLRQHPEPPAEDVAVFGGYQGMLDEVVQEKDWMAEPWDGEIQDVGGQSR